MPTILHADNDEKLEKWLQHAVTQSLIYLCSSLCIKYAPLHISVVVILDILPGSIYIFTVVHCKATAHIFMGLYDLLILIYLTINIKIT